jgi:protein-arginine kinase activator protein McsA
VFVEHEVEDEFDDDELVGRLTQLRESLREEYSIGKTLQERLREAVDQEQYELAARLRDELAKRHGA